MSSTSNVNNNVLQTNLTNSVNNNMLPTNSTNSANNSALQTNLTNNANNGFNFTNKSSFFRPDNLFSISSSDGKAFVNSIKKEAFAEGFQLTSLRKKDGEYNVLRCSRYNDPETRCSYRLNIQQYNVGKPDHFFKILNTSTISHNHPMNPLSFAHKNVDDDTKQVMNTMSKCNISSTKISDFLYESKSIRITSSQVRYVINQDKQKDNKIETEELIDKIVKEDGLYFVLDDPCGDVNYRRAIFTVTHDELDNLQKFGDFISIDPTYPNLTSNWTTIPLTVVGHARELRSGGVIFCSNVTSDVYTWVIKILANNLPCYNILRTISSDDDQNLEAAWNNIEQDPSCFHLSRIICIWHKIKNLKDEMKNVDMSKEDQDKVIKLFHEMAFTRNEDKCLELLQTIKQNYTKISSFINAFQEKYLRTSTKSFSKFTWSLGYISNNFSESHNSSIKNLLGNRSLTLVEMRDVITKAEMRRRTEKEYIKNRKIRKAIDQKTIELMRKFKIDRSISESIVGSMQKGDSLNLVQQGNLWIVEEQKTSDFYEVTNNDNQWHCTCGKLTSTGLPCSHILKVMREIQIEFAPESCLIAPRWILSEQMFENVMIKKLDEISIIQLRNDQPKSVKKRYTNITAKIHSIADIGSKTDENYEKTIGTLDKLENDLLGIKETKDARYRKCGRPRTSRLKRTNKNGNKVQKCQICKNNHNTSKCPHIKSVRDCINFEINTTASKRHCTICRSAGHFAKTCPALKLWKEVQEQNKNIEYEEEEEVIEYEYEEEEEEEIYE